MKKNLHSEYGYNAKVDSEKIKKDHLNTMIYEYDMGMLDKQLGHIDILDVHKHRNSGHNENEK